ncbi:DUF397 domain-containing protein [Streptomyces oceani]|uniref:DUF397 domain-containing protein n=1 Tax=Streptomyces oceani TaxID=1075402 RepID=UPI0009A0F52A|nr:DUF397 domain-containing protein [Streptomyces oceani]
MENSWQKSSYSGGGEGNSCVELMATEYTILLRESTNPDQLIEMQQETLKRLVHYLG